MADWKEIQAIADRRTGAFRRSFAEAVQQAADRATSRALEAAIARKDYQTAYRLAVEAWEKAAGTWRTKVTAHLRDTLDAAGRATAARFSTASNPFAFDVVNPHAVQWVQDHGAELVTNITTETRRALQTVLDRMVTGGRTVRQTGADIVDLGIGLTERQATAVMNYREGLAEMGHTAARVEQMAERYRQRLIAQRGFTIATTENINAANQGVLEGWAQARASGFLPPDARKVWIVTPDDLACPLCLALNNQQQPLDHPFVAPNGKTVMAPTLHPRCRCAIGIVGGSGRGRRAA